MSESRQNTFFRTTRDIIRVLKPAQRKKALLTVFLILFNATLDVLSLASVLPFVLLFLDASIFRENQFVVSLYNFFSFQSQEQFLMAALFFLLFLFVLKNGVGVLIHYFQSRFVYSVSTELSRREFRNFYCKDYLYFTKTSSSIPARNILNIPTEYSVYMLLSGISFLSESIVLLLISTAIAIYNFKIFALLLLIFVPLIFLIYRLKKDKLAEIGQISEELKPINLQKLFEGIKGFVEIKLYGKERRFLNRFLNVQKRLNCNFALFNTISMIPLRLIEITALLGLMAILTYSMFLSLPKSDVIVLLSLFTASAYRVMPSLNRMFTSIINIKTFRYALDIINKGDEEQSVPAFAAPKPKVLKLTKQIELRNISFAYPDQTAFELRDINVAVRKGEIIGFIGRSGAGKTTLMNLLLRFLQEQSGQILADDQPLNKEDVQAWWDLIGYVKQDPFILDGTISENIAFGETALEMDTGKLNSVIQQSDLAAFVSSLPDGLNTNIGEEGAKLSSGQQQRIAIARALYRDAQLFLFDEATSELDSQTEMEIVNAIHKLSGQNIFIVIIAHRMTTLKHCDRIYELKDGEIAGVYRYEELYEKEVQLF